MKESPVRESSRLLIVNQLLNFFWTALCFLPVLVYWIPRGADIWLYGSAAFSIVSGLVPERFFKRLQISRRPRFYEKSGVRTIRKFVQHGDLINRLYRQQSPGYKITGDVRRMKGYLKTIAMYERYHFMCCVFFLCTAIFGLSERRFLLALLIMVSNVLYNIFPIFLQQYNRIRIQALLAESGKRTVPRLV
jgi:hypothetical protein